MRNPRTLAIALGALIVVLAGFLFLRSPRPIIELKAETIFSIGPFDVTNTYITSWLVIVFLVGFSYFATRRLHLVPRGVQNLFEAVIEAIWNLVVNTAGEKHARRFFPVVATILLYVAIANWFGLLPLFTTVGTVEELKAEEEEEVPEHAIIFRQVGGISVAMPNADDVEVEVAEDASLDEKEAAVQDATSDLGDDEKAGILVPFLRSVNTDLNAPLSLAIWSAIFVEFWGITTFGFFRYGTRFFNPRYVLEAMAALGQMALSLLRLSFTEFLDAFTRAVGAFAGLLGGMVEFIAEAARLISFTFRLFGNIFAGEVLFLVAVFLAPLGTLLIVYGLEIFVGAIQAFIFAMLTLVFGVIAVQEAAHAATHEEGGGHD